MANMKTRLNSIFGNISSENPPEALFIFNKSSVDKNFFYVTGLFNGVFENCGVLFCRDGTVYLFTTSLEEEAARSLEASAELIVYKDKKGREEGLKNILSKFDKIGICYNSISYMFYLYLEQTFPGIEWIDVGKAFKKSRMIKTADEIAKIRKAADIADAVADSIPEFLKCGMTELDLAAEIDYRVKKAGAHKAAFHTIAAFGKNSSMPHYSGSDVQLKAGDIVLVDFGAEYMGYVSDISRTYFTKEPEKKALDMFETVLEAQKRAIELIKPGKNADQVEKEVRQVTERKEVFRGRFIHSLGHSIGLDVHDDGYPDDDFAKEFRENMVLTVEPGMYLPGQYGIRIEDDIVVKGSGCEVITKAKKEPFTHEIQ
jgi:Xaa-Pro dipeptidase